MSLLYATSTAIHAVATAQWEVVLTINHDDALDA
jgi:hypothetical protein